MHSKRRYKICTCSVILWELESFRNYKGFSIIFPLDEINVLRKTEFFWFLSTSSLRSKRFRLVSEQRKTEERDPRFWPREKWNKSQKMKVGEGVGQGRKLPHPLPALSLTPFFARSLTLVPRSLLLNRTETLATQAILHHIFESENFRFPFLYEKYPNLRSEMWRSNSSENRREFY